MINKLDVDDVKIFSMEDLLKSTRFRERLIERLAQSGIKLKNKGGEK